MSTKKELQEKIKQIQKQIDECQNDAQAILLQKELIDLFGEVFKDKDFLIDLVNQNKK